MKYNIFFLNVVWCLVFPLCLWGQAIPTSAKPTMKIAVIANFSVPNPSTSNPYGGHFLDGVRLGIDEYNAKPDSKFHITLVTVDHGDVKIRGCKKVCVNGQLRG